MWGCLTLSHSICASLWRGLYFPAFLRSFLKGPSRPVTQWLSVLSLCSITSSRWMPDSLVALPWPVRPQAIPWPMWQPSWLWASLCLSSGTRWGRDQGGKRVGSWRQHSWSRKKTLARICGNGESYLESHPLCLPLCPFDTPTCWIPGIRWQGEQQPLNPAWIIVWWRFLAGTSASSSASARRLEAAWRVLVRETHLWRTLPRSLPRGPTCPKNLEYHRVSSLAWPFSSYISSFLKHSFSVLIGTFQTKI